MAENLPPPPPLSEQPDPKRQKMSTTTTSDEENSENAATIPKTPKYKRRKIAIFFAYCGVGYQGMQKNPGAKTIEGDFEEALYFAGAVPESERGMPRRYDWARSARTDKGVSAVGQVVSGKFYVDPPGFVERLNSHLSPQIRVFGYKRGTPSFNAKKFCDRRRYVYLLPVFALDPSCHRDRESVLASVGSGNELIKCVECSERGRKVFGVMGKRSFESKIRGGDGVYSNDGSGFVESKIVVDCDNENGNVAAMRIEEESEHVKEVAVEDKIGEDFSEKGNDDGGSGNAEALQNENGNVEARRIEEESEHVKGVLVEDKIAENSSEKGNDDGGSGNANGNDEALQIQGSERVKEVLVEDKIADDSSEKGIDYGGSGNGSSEMKTMKEDKSEFEKKSEFCYGEMEKERFNRILKYYEGTHNFHNFTTRTKADDPSAQRYILSFNANTVLNIEGIDFIKCEVVGQSFMLHQIRKMIGLGVAIMRICCPESMIEKAFEQKVNINVPMAPEVGLYLDECFFSSYNKKWENTHEEMSLKAYAEEAEDFKTKYIYPHIGATEHKDGAVAVWLHSLNHRNYPDLRVSDSTIADGNTEVENFASSEVKNDETVNMDE